MEDAQKEERRAQPRTKIGLDVLCSSGREEGTAILKHLSVSAALLESATIGPAVGDSVTIRLQAESDEEPDLLRTTVVRQTAECAWWRRRGQRGPQSARPQVPARAPTPHAPARVCYLPSRP